MSPGLLTSAGLFPPVLCSVSCLLICVVLCFFCSFLSSCPAGCLCMSGLIAVVCSLDLSFHQFLLIDPDRFMSFISVFISCDFSSSLSSKPDSVSVFINLSVRSPHTVSQFVSVSPRVFVFLAVPLPPSTSLCPHFNLFSRSMAACLFLQ